MKPIAIILHHEAGNNGFDSVNEYHRQKWNRMIMENGSWIPVYKLKDIAGKPIRDMTGEEAKTIGTLSSKGFYCGYHWFLDKRRGWVQARAENETGAHCIGWNDKSVGACLQGDFSRETLPEDTAAILKAKIDEMGTRLKIPQKEFYGHKEKQLSKPTSCPASLMDFVVEYREAKEETDITFLQKRIIELSKVAISLLQKLLSLKK